MRHFSCDLCGKDITAAADARFVVRVEVASVGVPALAEADLDGDPIDAMADLLDDLELDPDATPPPPAAATAGPERLEFDLCAGCRPRYLSDPIGRGRRALRFSPN
jgi:hypothetical protein